MCDLRSISWTGYYILVIIWWLGILSGVVYGIVKLIKSIKDICKPSAYDVPTKKITADEIKIEIIDGLKTVGIVILWGVGIVIVVTLILFIFGWIGCHVGFTDWLAQHKFL